MNPVLASVCFHIIYLHLRNFSLVSVHTITRQVYSLTIFYVAARNAAETERSNRLFKLFHCKP